MNQTRILASLRREVRERAGQRCEYCLFPESESIVPHEPDHLIALKHGGQTTFENLALACCYCNRFKGSDIASIDAVTGELVGLFNPRTQRWFEHFLFKDGYIVPLTPAGRVTEKLLRFNLRAHVAIRRRLMSQAQYP